MAQKDVGTASVRAAQVDAADTLDRMENAADLVKQFYETKGAEREAALKIQNPEERSKQVKLIDAQIADVRKESEADTTDIAQAVGAVLAKEQQLDADFDELSTYDEAQKAESDAAIAEVAAA